MRARYDRLIVTGLTARAPAKLNLQLSVGLLRPDGYHDLATIFHAVSLFDEVTVRPAGRVTVRVAGEGAGEVPGGRGNLAVRAANALRKAAGIRDGAEISIGKRIPVAAGLAGGSADAAATLVACNRLWQAGLGPAELSELAALVGSDVPFSLAGGTAVGLGRGEQLSQALVSGRYHWVLAVADAGLATADVYAECDRLRAARRRRRAGPRAAVTRARAGERSAATCSRRCAPAMPPRSARCSATTCSPPRCRSGRSFAGPCRQAESTGRSGLSSPARVPPAVSWPGGRNMRSTLPPRSRARVCAVRWPASVAPCQVRRS